MAAALTAKQTFEQGATAAGLPTVTINLADLKATVGLLSQFVEAGLVASTSEARRQIKSGGLKVNDTVVIDEKAKLSEADLTPDGVIKLSLGKKKHVLLKPA